MNLFTDMGVPPATPQAGLAPGAPSSDATRPGSVILTPAAGSLLQVGTPVVISGTAADGGGGIVAGVEVSFDNGTTWHPAIGRESWTFTWTPAASGSRRPAEPRDRRHRQSGDPVGGRLRFGPARLPVQPLERFDVPPSRRIRRRGPSKSA